MINKTNWLLHPDVLSQFISMKLVCIIVMYHVPLFYIPIACLENLVSNFNFVQDAGKELEI